MSAAGIVNPFARRESHTRNQLLAYKVLVPVSYILLLVSGFYYEFAAPHDGHKPRGSIWHWNLATPFSQNAILTSLYW
jgi:hypothetical protein